MQDVNFKYYLRYYDEQTPAWVYYYIDSNGDLADTTTKTELPQAPSGWEQQSLTWERGFTYYGVFTNYSNPLRFVRDGAKILLNLYYNYGVEANCELLIEKLNTTVATWGYEEYYSGDIDFSKLKQIKDYVEVPIMERDFLAEMKAKENSMLEIPVYTNPDSVWVKMDGLLQTAIGDFTSIDQPRYDNGNIDSFGESHGGLNIIRKALPTLLFYGNLRGYSNGDISVKGNNYINPVNRFPASTGNSGVFDNTLEPYYVLENVSTQDTYEINLSGVVDMDVVNNSVGSDNCTPIIGVWQTLSNIVITDTTVGTGVSVSPNPTVYQNQVIEFTDTITLMPNEKMYIYIGMNHTVFPSSVASMHFNSFELTINWLNKVRDSFIKCLPASSVLESLVDNIKSTTTVENTPCDEFEGYLLTSGDAIRGLINSVLKTSFSDYYNAHNCMFNSAFSYDKVSDEVRFLNKYEVFDLVETILDIGEVNNIEVTPLTSEMFSRLKIGYKDYSYDEVNGKDEFNTSTEWQSGVKRVTNERNLISPYRADMYGIESVRANPFNKTTADSDMDNDVFWIHADMSAVAGQIPAGYDGAGEDYYDLYRDSGLTITGLVSPTTAYNIDFSPKRRIYAHGYWIKSATYYPSTTDILTFNTSGKTTNGNVAMETDDGVTIINEKSSVPYSSLPDTDEGTPRSEIFYPIIFTVDTKIPLNIKTIMNNPYREISFRYKGNTYYGWLLSVSDSPSFKPKQTYKLICSPTTDINTLINGI